MWQCTDEEFRATKKSTEFADFESASVGQRHRPTLESARGYPSVRRLVTAAGGSSCAAVLCPRFNRLIALMASSKSSPSTPSWVALPLAITAGSCLLGSAVWSYRRSLRASATPPPPSLGPAPPSLPFDPSALARRALLYGTAWALAGGTALAVSVALVLDVRDVSWGKFAVVCVFWSVFQRGGEVWCRNSPTAPPHPPTPQLNGFARRMEEIVPKFIARIAAAIEPVSGRGGGLPRG